MFIFLNIEKLLFYLWWLLRLKKNLFVFCKLLFIKVSLLFINSSVRVVYGYENEYDFFIEVFVSLLGFFG